MNRKIFLQVINKEKTSKIPIWIMRQAGRYLPEYNKIRKNTNSFLDLCYNPKLAAEVSLQPIKRFNFDVSIIFADILLVPDALGQKLDFIPNKGPILDKINTIEQLNNIIPDNFDKFHQHLNPIYETIDILKNSLPQETTLMGFAGAPWTVATYMVLGQGKQNLNILIKWVNENTYFFDKLINILIESTTEYLLKQVKSGVECLQLFDSWSGVLFNENFEKWCIKPAQKIVNNIKSVYPDIPLIGFPRNSSKKILNYVKQTKFDAVSISNDVNLEWIKDNIQTICPIQGCLSPEILLTGKKLEQEVLKILNTFKDKEYIFNLSHGINKDTPIENVEKLLQIVRNFKK